jgi:hypothetical protein
VSSSSTEEPALPHPVRCFQALAALATHRAATKGDVAVLAVILSRYNARTGTAWPGINRIAEEARVDRATVLRAIPRLEALGCIVVNRSQRGRSNRYTPTFIASFTDGTSVTHATSGFDVTSVSDATSSSNATPLVSLVQPQVVAPMQPELLYRTSPKNVSNSIDQRAAQSTTKRADQFEELWAINRRKVNRKAALKEFYKLAPTDAQFIEIRNALAAQAASPKWILEPQFIPHLSTWLKGQRWLDAIEPVHDAAVQRGDRHLSAVDRVKAANRAADQRERGCSAGFKPRVNDNFVGKNYVGTPIESLPKDLREAVEKALAEPYGAESIATPQRASS